MKTPCGKTLAQIEPKAREFIKLMAGIDVGRLFTFSMPRGTMTFEFDPRQAGGDFIELMDKLTEVTGTRYKLESSNWLGTVCAWEFEGRRIALEHKHGSPEVAAIELAWQRN